MSKIYIKKQGNILLGILIGSIAFYGGIIYVAVKIIL